MTKLPDGLVAWSVTKLPDGLMAWSVTKLPDGSGLYSGQVSRGPSQLVQWKDLPTIQWVVQ